MLIMQKTCWPNIWTKPWKVMCRLTIHIVTGGLGSSSRSVSALCTVLAKLCSITMLHFGVATAVFVSGKKQTNKQLRSLVSICVAHKPHHSFWEAQRWKHTCYIWEHGLGEPLWQFMHIRTGGILQLETETGKQVEGVRVEHSIACPDKPLSPAFRQQDRLLQICHLSASFPRYSPAGVRGCVVVTDLPRTIK